MTPALPRRTCGGGIDRRAHGRQTAAVCRTPMANLQLNCNRCLGPTRVRHAVRRGTRAMLSFAAAVR